MKGNRALPCGFRESESYHQKKFLSGVSCAFLTNPFCNSQRNRLVTLSGKKLGGIELYARFVNKSSLKATNFSHLLHGSKKNSSFASLLGSRGILPPGQYLNASPGGGMVDALVSGASAARRAGSSPVLGTPKSRNSLIIKSCGIFHSIFVSKLSAKV